MGFYLIQTFNIVISKPESFAKSLSEVKEGKVEKVLHYSPTSTLFYDFFLQRNKIIIITILVY